MTTTAITINPVRSSMSWAAATLAELCDRIDGGEEPTEALVILFKETQLDLADAVDRRVALLKHIEGAAATARAVSDEWAAESARLSRLHDHIKASTKQDILAKPGVFPDRAAKGRIGTLRVQNNGGVTPVETDFAGKELTEELIAMFGIDERFVRVKTSYSLKLDELRAALEAKEEIAWARLGSRGTSLHVKAVAR